MNDESLIEKNDTEEKPPVLSSWKRLYAIEISFLIFLILVFFIITKVFE